MSPAGPRLRDALALARELLANAGGDPVLEAQVLLGHVLGRSRAWLVAHDADPLSDSDHRAYRALLRRRAAGEPVAYLTGRREFWSLELAVDRAVLIPRPETETLVERAVSHLADDAAAQICDVGTGSGAVALAIAMERPRARVIATELSRAALRIAAANARHHAPGRVGLLAARWLHPLRDAGLDMVVSNPPYVAAGDRHLAQGDLRFEPELALVSGDDGLADLSALAAQAPRCLRPGGWLLTEHGADQGPAVRTLFADAGFTAVSTHRDLAGLERVTEGRRD